MKTLNQNSFDTLLQDAGIKSRLRKDLKFVASTAHLIDSWSEYELLCIADRTNDKGVLLLQPASTLFVAPYELSRTIVDSKTGRQRAIICDFCYTWQPGSNAASITFTHPDDKRHIRFLCCGDLKCSQHVRTITSASIVSRSQLRENLSNEDRVERLKMKITELIDHIGARSATT